MSARARAAVVAFAAALVCVSLPAAAHPAGFTSVNRYVGVECTAEGALRVAYLLDFAEMPSYAELEELDADHDGQLSPAEQRAYLDRRLPPLVAAWTVVLDGARASPRVMGSRLEILEGERGLSTVRIEAEVRVDRPAAAPPVGTEVTVVVHDGALADHAGWREMAASDSSGSTLAGGPKEDPSRALAYVPGATPPRVDDASFRFHLSPAVPGPAAPVAAPAFPAPRVDPWLASVSQAMRGSSDSPAFTLLALVLALGLGAAHALSPGHGKALAATYLTGARARPSQALLFGATVTASHTAVVFLVGLGAIAVEHTVGSDRLLRGLEALSAVVVVGLGLWQLSARWREATGAAGDHSHDEGPRGGSVVALGLSAGITPCPSALAILLAAVALHRYAFGLALVGAFSLGVAVTLTAAGLLVVLARRRLERVPSAGRLLRWLPVASSLCVLVLGVLLCASAWTGSG
ncbi:MAG TPA: sulfite exporter TauE/SafE family protein [Polyangiaceae bacterium]